ncbi:unnamed protein product [Gulo gulo]|uniref:Uncharacterized protein n=1 Tax=Gulo gulo TaxID=48420 RepID=A0A9X9M4X1_GULGU|nr:unnamed protein product [Gulo gulo]
MVPASCCAVTMTPSLPKPSSPEQKFDPQPEPTVTFLFNLLSTAEPTESKELEEVLESQECQFLDKEDWGPRRTSKEISHLQSDCRRLWESLSTIQADNQALAEKLQNLPTLSYESLRKEAKALQEEVKAVVEGAQAVQEDAQAIQGWHCSRCTGSPTAACREEGHAFPGRSLSSPSL